MKFRFSDEQNLHYFLLRNACGGSNLHCIALQMEHKDLKNIIVLNGYFFGSFNCITLIAASIITTHVGSDEDFAATDVTCYCYSR